MKITVCGAGNAAQTLISLLASAGRHEVAVYAPLADEAERLAQAVTGGLEVVFAGGRRLVGQPDLVTADPAMAGREAGLVLLALPAFAHEEVLRALAPHLPADAWIGALPARGGFDWLARAVLSDRDTVGDRPEPEDTVREQVLFGLQTLPWACRISDWGRLVTVMGTKAVVDLAAWPAEKASDVAATLDEMIGVPLHPVSGFLALTLANTGQLIHPGIMYGLFHDWDGQPFGEDQAPLFYGGVDDESAVVLQAMSDEIQAICRALEQAAPGLDLSDVATLRDWLLRAYPGQIADESTLRAAFNSNRAYAGLRAPINLVEENAYEPWFASRYLSEDVPFSLLVSRGIAELAGVATPTIDRAIIWAQERLGKEYLAGGRLAGRDVAESRAPQRFGIDTVEALLQAAWRG